MKKQKKTKFKERGFQIVNDKGHYLIYNQYGEFMGSCDASQLQKTLDNFEKGAGLLDNASYFLKGDLYGRYYFRFT